MAKRSLHRGSRPMVGPISANDGTMETGRNCMTAASLDNMPQGGIKTRDTAQAHKKKGLKNYLYYLGSSLL